MKWLIRFFKKFLLNDVFTPSTIAKLTYIERKSLENTLLKFIQMPGMQIVLYGHSGCGKSTVVNQILDKLKIKKIISRCHSETTFNDLILDAFDQLNMFYTSETSVKKIYTTQGGVQTNYLDIVTKISASISSESTSQKKRVIPVQLTIQRLAELMGAAKLNWIIEDFHKVNEIDKKKIADVLKIFVDTSNDFRSVKIICIGAVGTARELVEFDSNLSTRIAEMYVPLFQADELEKIINKGFDLMNVKCTNEIKNKIIYFSNNLPAICHQICYDLCYNKELTKTKIVATKIKENDFPQAVISVVKKNGDTYNKIYDHICTNQIRKAILMALSNSEKESVGVLELYNGTKKIQSVQKSEFYRQIQELTTNEYEEVFRFDKNAQKYSFSSPFFQNFVKMKIAIEEAEQKEREQKQRRKYSLIPKDYNLILNEEFYYNYAIEFNKIFQKRFSEYLNRYPNNKIDIPSKGQKK